jgi:hypothetical protein
MCFLEPAWSNIFRKLLNLLDKIISPIPTSPIISKEVLHVGGGLKCGNFGSQICVKNYYIYKYYKNGMLYTKNSIRSH